jgi:LemA protein
VTHLLILIILLILTTLILWFVITYNQFIRWRNLMKEGWSGVDVQLKRRRDLIPNLIETVKGYSSHEKELFENTARLRSEAQNSGDLRATSIVENSLTQSIRSIFAVAEAYPDLKASQNFLDLQHNLVAVEDELQLARRYYNGTVRSFNTLVQSFPSMIIAGFSGFQPAEFFELESASEALVPQVGF